MIDFNRRNGFNINAINFSENTMTVAEFWNNAFISALSRVAAVDAREEANTALELAIQHWQESARGMEPTWTRYSDLSLSDVQKPRSQDGQGAGAATSR